MRAWLGIFVLVIYLIIPDLSFCQQEHGAIAMQSRRGFVTQVDSIGSLLVISDGGEELRFTVDPEARIQCGVNNITLDDLKSNDNVSVEYYNSSDGVLKAISITDNNAISSF